LYCGCVFDRVSTFDIGVFELEIDLTTEKALNLEKTVYTSSGGVSCLGFEKSTSLSLALFKDTSSLYIIKFASSASTTGILILI